MEIKENGDGFGANSKRKSLSSIPEHQRIKIVKFLRDKENEFPMNNCADHETFQRGFSYRKERDDFF